MVDGQLCSMCVDYWWMISSSSLLLTISTMPNNPDTPLSLSYPLPHATLLCSVCPLALRLTLRVRSGRDEAECRPPLVMAASSRGILSQGSDVSVCPLTVIAVSSSLSTLHTPKLQCVAGWAILIFIHFKIHRSLVLAAHNHGGKGRPAPGTGVQITFKNPKGEVIKTVEANEGDDIVDLSWEHDLDIEGIE